MKSKLPASICVSLLSITMATTTVMAAEYTQAWKKTGFMSPESVSYDPVSKSLFVSNINSPNPTEANGKGYVSQLDLDGNVLKEKFVDGLNAPKGTYVVDGKLYVAGVEQVSEIDAATGKILNTYKAPGATFFNDVAVGPDGKVFVTETAQGAIYALENGKLSQWLADPQLAGANGIIVKGGTLLVATLGDISGGFDKLKPSNVKSVDIATKKVADYGSPAPIGGLDGIELTDAGVMVTDNSGGRLLEVKSDGSTAVLATPGPGAADHEYIPDQHLVVIPMLQSGEVLAYKAAM
jgi:hypothetical protein